MSPSAALADRDLVPRFRAGDPAARDELMARYLPRARRVALRYHHRGEPLDDLEQVASMGLVKALYRWEPDQGAQLWSYALPTIVGELKRHFRDACWGMRVPRAMQDRALAVQGGFTRLSAKLGRPPTPAELAEALELSSEEVLEAIEAGAAYEPPSLDAALAAGGELSASHGDLLGREDEALAAAERRATLDPALRRLPPRDRVILHLRFERDLTQGEIAERIGVSQMHVSRLVRSALDRVRSGVGVEELAPAA